MITHKKKFGVYHWDTFDNETILMHQCNTQEAAEKYVQKHYGERISPNGADRVDIVDKKGAVLRTYTVK